jgi:hypothetical protein
METNSNLSHIENKLNEIKKAFEIIANSLPINSEKFVEMFNELTSCEIEYDIFPKVERIERVTENKEHRIYYVKDRVYCIENNIEKDYIVEAKVVDVFDKYKTVAIIHEYKIQSIEQIR